MARLAGLSWGLTVNQAQPGSLHAKGYDAFATGAPGQPVFVLCDGANGTPRGGEFAQALSGKFLQSFSEPLARADRQPNRQSVDLVALGRRLDELGQFLDLQFTDSASTLTAARYHEERLQLMQVGDSHALAFRRSMIRGWQHVTSLGRHQNQAGRPTQLIGAPLPVQPFWYETDEPGDWIVALMTDGAGDFLELADLVDQLQLLGRSQPSLSDLSFCAQSLSQTALARSSDDDISVVLIWMRLD